MMGNTVDGYMFLDMLLYMQKCPHERLEMIFMSRRGSQVWATHLA